MNIKQRHFIQKSQIKDLKDDILHHYNQKFLDQIFPKKAKIELIETDAGDTLFAVNDILKLWKSKEGYIPVLTLLLDKKVTLKKVVVDMGAIKFITNSADVMAPGVTKIDPTIKKGDIVEIVDETHDRSLAVGKAMYDADEMNKMDSGKIIKNLHTIQDSVWEFEKVFS
ncbi:MAG: RNA-binding protein [Promethearchaeota archaeon]|nr:MAG: RNA-binding protein [Candidatus Lokiarchaeota archaeon]